VTGIPSSSTHAPAEGPETFAKWVREYFTSYGYIGSYHLAGNIRAAFTGIGTADVSSLINSTHWLADGRILLAPIVYRDKARRDTDGTWKNHCTRARRAPMVDHRRILSHPPRPHSHPPGLRHR
jgi:hypothetical protein